MVLSELKKAIDEALEESDIVEIRLTRRAMKQFEEQLGEHAHEKVRRCITAIFGIPVVVDDAVPPDKMWIIGKKVKGGCVMKEGLLKKRIREAGMGHDSQIAEDADKEGLFLLVDEANKEYPKVSQKWVPVKGHRVDWKLLAHQMELKIIEFENFGKKWLGEVKKE